MTKDGSHVDFESLNWRACYLVSLPVLLYIKEHYQSKTYEAFFAVDSGPEGAVRDGKGQIIGVTRLLQ